MDRRVRGQQAKLRNLKTRKGGKGGCWSNMSKNGKMTTPVVGDPNDQGR